MNRKVLVGVLAVVVIGGAVLFYPKTYSYSLPGDPVNHICIGLEIPRMMIGETVIDCYGILIEDGPNCNFFCKKTEYRSYKIMNSSAKERFNLTLWEMMKRCGCLQKAGAVGGNETGRGLIAEGNLTNLTEEAEGKKINVTQQEKIRCSQVSLDFQSYQYENNTLKVDAANYGTVPVRPKIRLVSGENVLREKEIGLNPGEGKTVSFEEVKEIVNRSLEAYSEDCGVLLEENMPSYLSG